MRYEKSAGIIVYFLDEEPKFLLLKYKNYWGFPKGLIEAGESEEEAAIRELEEETRLEAEIITGFRQEQEWFFRINNKTVKKKAVFFLGKISKEDAEKVKISWEHEDFIWLSYQEALEKMKIKNNKEMLKIAYEFILKFEKQKKLV